MKNDNPTPAIRLLRLLFNAEPELITWFTDGDHDFLTETINKGGEIEPILEKLFIYRVEHESAHSPTAKEQEQERQERHLFEKRFYCGEIGESTFVDRLRNDHRKYKDRLRAGETPLSLRQWIRTYEGEAVYDEFLLQKTREKDQKKNQKSWSDGTRWRTRAQRKGVKNNNKAKDKAKKNEEE